MGDFRLAGKLLLIIGAIFVLAGIIMLFGHKIPYIGRLPGDILIHRKNFTFYFPVTTLVILNIIILLIIYLFKR